MQTNESSYLPVRTGYTLIPIQHGQQERRQPGSHFQRSLWYKAHRAPTGVANKTTAAGPGG